MKNWNNFKSKLLLDPEVKQQYQQLGPKYQIIKQLIDTRISQGLTQESLAQRIGTKQSAIARFESGDVNPTLEFLQSLTLALGHKLEIKIV